MKTPQRYDEWVYNAHNINDPLTMKEALSSPEKNQWMKAMKSEIDSLHTNIVLDLTELTVKPLAESGCSKENTMQMETWNIIKLD